MISEKGSSSLPLQKFGFVLNKQEFVDAIALRYNIPIKNIAATCVCGQENSVDHCLMCKKGGFVSLRHNSLRDTIAELLTEVCKDVKTEPALIPITNERLPHSTNVTDDARLDVSARSFWSPLARAFFDIRVTHPGAQTNMSRSIEQMYNAQETEKKRIYNNRVIQVGKGSFTPLVFSTTGGMGKEAETFVKHLAQKITLKKSRIYSNVVSFIRRRLRFDLLKTSLISLRGHRGYIKRIPLAINELDYNLQKRAIM